MACLRLCDVIEVVVFWTSLYRRQAIGSDESWHVEGSRCCDVFSEAMACLRLFGVVCDNNSF